VVRWILKNCRVLKNFLFMNFPRLGYTFLDQTLPSDITPTLEELRIFDILNLQFFKNLISRCRNNLKTVQFYTVETDEWIDLVNEEVIKDIEIRSINDAVLATLLKFTKLERCNMWFIENSV
jgi:hypothetical protein